jgi:hypothetical protein
MQNGQQDQEGKMRSIIVAFSDPENANKIKNILVRHDLPVRGIATNGAMALRLTAPIDGGGLIVCGSRFADMTAMQMTSLLSEDYDVLMLGSAVNIESSFGHQDGLFSLSLPLQAEDLVSSARMLLETRQMYKNTWRSKKTTTVSSVSENDPKGRKPEDQRIIDQAKAVLMTRNYLSEQEAHRYLQKASMDTGTKLVDMARSVLKSQEN